MKYVALVAFLTLAVAGAATLARAPSSEAADRAVASEAADMREMTLPVEGMTCGGCAASVNYVLSQIDGVTDYRADHEKHNAWVRYDSARLTPDTIVDTINEKTHYRASVPEQATTQGSQTWLEMQDTEDK